MELNRAKLALATLVVAGCAAPATIERPLHERYDTHWSQRLVPMLQEAVRFPTYAGNARAFADQKAWLARTAKGLGFSFRDAGKVDEIELAGPPNAPVLGLAVHGDVVPVGGRWSFPPFEANVRDGMLLGRGVADDKGPLVQALVAMKVLEESARPRTHTIRLLVGSDEETSSSDMREYFASHKAPDLTLVLDGDFPVLVGEKAVNTLFVASALGNRGSTEVQLITIDAGSATNVVPDTATLVLDGNAEALADLWKRISSRPLPDGTRLEAEFQGNVLTVRAHGKAAHAGVNAVGGRNALIALASAAAPELPASGGRDLLAFVLLAGQDLRGTGLGIAEAHPVFGYPVVVPTFARTADGRARVGVNIRSNPGASGAVLKRAMLAAVDRFNGKEGASLEPTANFVAEPLAHDPQAKIVRRLLAAYQRSTGRTDAPGVTAGGTYAKHIPNSIVYGMWFPGKPYPGHDVDEKVSIEDLHRGSHALLEALADLAYGDPITEPLKR